VPESRRFHRDPVTWVAYVLVAWFAYLQAAPGLVIPYLRTELHLSYSSGGLHVAAFALGSMAAGLASARLEHALGRGTLLWSGAVCMGAGGVGLAAGQVIAVTVGSVLLIGIGGGTLLITAQAVLADHHGELRAIALTEANVAASAAYLVLIGALSLAAATGAGWRTALIASLLVPALTWAGGRRLAIEAPPAPSGGQGRLPGLFWAAAVMILCTTAVEWCVTAWGATFVGDATGASAAVAVALMAGYFGGVLVGRIAGSRLARRIDPARLLGWAMVLSAAGFVVLWPAGSPVQALIGLAVIGAGIGNLFPLSLAVAVALAPGRAVSASGRAVLMAATAVLLAPLTVGALADALSLKAAFVVVPVMLALAAVGLAVVRLRGRRVAQVG
jgi:MFS family permease